MDCNCCVCTQLCERDCDMYADATTLTIEEEDELRRMLPALRAIIKRFAGMNLDEPIDDLIARSSLGDEEALAMRAQASPDAVARILKRVDELDATVVHESDLFADDVIAEAAEALWDSSVPNEAGDLAGQPAETRELLHNEAREVIDAAIQAARHKKTKARA